MCGKDTNLVIALIEGTELKVCEGCAKFGKIIRRIQPEPTKKERKIIEKTKSDEKEEIIEVIVEDYNKKIKQAREKLSLDQKDFAKKINEKASLMHKIESGHFKPSINLARKIEKFLKIKLIEQQEIKDKNFNTTKSDAFTIGDILKKMR